MTRTKQANNESGAVLNRDFPRRGRSLIMVAEELRRFYPNAKPEHIEMALEQFGDYECGEGDSEIELFGNVLAAVIIDESIGKRGGSMEILEELWYGNISPWERDFKRGSTFEAAGVHRQARGRTTKTDER